MSPIIFRGGFSASTMVLAFSLTVLGPGCSCSKDEKQDQADEQAQAEAGSRAETTLDYQLNPSEQQKAQELLGQFDEKNWRFPPQEVNKKSNARVFTYLAATGDRPEVIGAALQAMYSAYSSHSKRKVKPDEDFAKAVSKHLKSDNPKIVARALRAARTAMSGKTGNPRLVKEVVAMADRYPEGPGRYALIDALRVVSFNNRNDELMQVFVSSLNDKQPYVLSYALQALYRSSRSLKDRQPVAERALELAKHENPGVRGRAIELLGSVGRGPHKERTLKVVLAALKDEHPYVRSEAAGSAARLRHKPAVHQLMELVAQKERNRYMLEGWTTLGGRPGRLHHDGSAWSYVQDAAINAIRSLSGGKLELERISAKAIDEGLAKNVELTKKWYAKNKANIPTE